MTVDARPKQLSVPDQHGPWSWRIFGSQAEAWRFFHRLQDGDPPPRQLDAPHVAPDGTLIPAGTWLVLYRPIITGRMSPSRQFWHACGE